jgi:hypothetical protein
MALVLALMRDTPSQSLRPESEQAFTVGGVNDDTLNLTSTNQRTSRVSDPRRSRMARSGVGRNGIAAD